MDHCFEFVGWIGNNQDTDCAPEIFEMTVLDSVVASLIDIDSVNCLDDYMDSNRWLKSACDRERQCDDLIAGVKREAAHAINQYSHRCPNSSNTK